MNKDLRNSEVQEGFATIEVAGEFPTMNQIIEASKKSHHEYRKMKIEFTGLVKKEALEFIEDSEFNYKHECPLFIKMTWFRSSRRADPDNIAAGKKFVMDGLVDAGIIEGDSWKHINAFMDRFDISKQFPRVRIEIYGLNKIPKEAESSSQNI